MTAEQAIERSVSRSEVVRVEYDEDMACSLGFAAEDSIVDGDVTEFWGTTHDGHEWRVHMG